VRRVAYQSEYIPLSGLNSVSTGILILVDRTVYVWVEENLVVSGWLLTLNLLNPIGYKPFVRYKAVETPAIAELK
jgi:hypothetical protein